MKVLAIQSSNRPDGLTASLARSVLKGFTERAEQVSKETSLEMSTEVVDLNSLNISVCKACGEIGWGICRQGQPCIQQDDFADLYAKIVEADALVFATPVYFWDLSETAKVFLDRLRRAEWPLRESGKLRGKPVIGIAAAGGSGTGAPSAIKNLEAYMTYMGMRHVIYLPVSRQNKEVQLQASVEAGRHLFDVLSGRA